MYTQWIDMTAKLWVSLKKFFAATKCRSMIVFGGPAMTIRETIRKELGRRGWSHYRLVKELKGSVPATTVYEYLANKTDLGSERVSKILDALGLTITSKPTTIKRGGRRLRKEK